MRNCVSAHFSFSAPLGCCASNSVASRDRRGGGASAWGGISPTLHGAALGTPGAVLRAETFDGPRRRARSLLPPPLPADVRAPLGRPAAPGSAEHPEERARGPRSNVLLKERLGARAPPKADTRWPHSARADPGGRGLMLCRSVAGRACAEAGRGPEVPEGTSRPGKHRTEVAAAGRAPPRIALPLGSIPNAHIDLSRFPHCKPAVSNVVNTAPIKETMRQSEQRHAGKKKKRSFL